MRLLHYSKTEIKQPRSAPQFGERFKPKGLWVSVEGPYDWRWWCEAEDFCDIPALVEHEVVLAKSAKILYLEDASEIDRFSRKYRVGSYSVDWEKVASKYDGIIIAPYCWERRMERSSDWYYPWDCASGCIWNASAIAKIKPQSVNVEREAVSEEALAEAKTK